MDAEWRQVAALNSQALKLLLDGFRFQFKDSNQHPLCHKPYRCLLYKSVQEKEMCFLLW